MSEASFGGKTHEDLMRQRDELRIAEEAERQIQHLKDIFGCYPEADPATKDMVISGELKKIKRKLESGREIGKLNDESSLAPGLTVFVPTEALVDFRATSPIYRADDFDYEQLIADSGGGITHTLGGLSLIRLPQGVYSADGFGSKKGRGNHYYSGVQIWAEGELNTTDGILAGAYGTWLAEIRQMYIVRIEGDSGELWQNPWFTPEGERRSMHSMAITK